MPFDGAASNDTPQSFAGRHVNEPALGQWAFRIAFLLFFLLFIEYIERRVVDRRRILSRTFDYVDIPSSYHGLDDAW